MTIDPFSAAIFDLDGTLVQSEHLHRESWIAPLADLGIEVAEDEYARTFAGKPGMQIIRDTIGLEGDAALVLYERVSTNYWDIATDRVAPTDGVVAFLQLITDVPKAVCTSAQSDSAHRMLDLLDLTRHFAAVVTASDIANGKPDPEPFLLASKRLAIHSTRCIAFEDSANGLRSARAAGMYCVGIGPGVAYYPELADMWIDDFVGLDPDGWFAQ